MEKQNEDINDVDVEVEVEAVSTPVPEKRASSPAPSPRPVKSFENRKKKNSAKKNAGNTKKKAQTARGGSNGKTRDADASAGRHAVTTSRGVVYVESYSDDDYEVHTGTKSRIVKIIVALFIVAAVVLAGIMFVNYCKRTVAGDRVYNGITLNGKSVAGFTLEELETYIDETYGAPVSGSTIEVKTGDDSLVYPLNSIISLPDTKALAEEIYGYARTGNVIGRAFTVIGLRDKGKEYSLDYSVNSTTIASITARLNEKNRTKVDPTYRIEEDRVVFTYGSNGLELKSEDITNSLIAYTDKLLESLSEGTASSSVSGTVVLVPQMTEFRKLLKINIVNDLPEKAIDASIERKSPTEVWIAPGKDGAEYDEGLLDQILTRINSGEASGSGEEILPIKRESAKFTKEFYEAVLFRDVLGSGDNQNTPEEDPAKAPLANRRDKNIQVAVEKLNGLIVMPGETLSFLDAIKVRETKSGYIDAYENYLDSENMVMAGGIAQVSTALYNAALLSDLEIVSRTKHNYAPQFGIMGFDAYTDVKNGTDLKIRNNGLLPVKINAYYMSGNLVISFSGTVFTQNDFLDEEGKPLDASMIPEGVTIVKEKVQKSLSMQIARRNAYLSIEFKDPMSPEGTQTVTQTGIGGYTLNLYMTVRTGNVEEKKFIGVENYDSRSEYIMVGTLKATEAPTDEPTEIPTDGPTETPTDIPTDPTDVPDATPTADPGATGMPQETVPPETPEAEP